MCGGEPRITILLLSLLSARCRPGCRTGSVWLTGNAALFAVCGRRAAGFSSQKKFDFFFAQRIVTLSNTVIFLDFL